VSAPIITVEGLGKRYRIRHQAERQRYVALRDVIADKAKAIFRRNGSAPAHTSHLTPHTSTEDFWALKDVSFEVRKGEVVGIIGRNGAGKSTLLKILSRITEPTEGRVTLRGRVASLLEVGTGFHPELTGRENIFLNGAILGMTRAEIRKKFDEIVAFAEVEKFLDTPVKRYSSGMYVRLAFAVAAHLEPEILVVDEVLAVGDAEFQKKFLGKMESVARSEGRTVLFVSHNMAAVANLCRKAILLSEGKLVAQDGTAEVVHRYLTANERPRAFQRNTPTSAEHPIRIVNFSVQPEYPATGEPVEFAFELERAAAGTRELPLDLAVSVLTLEGLKIVQIFSQHMGGGFRIPPGRSRVVARLKQLPLAPGEYLLNLWAGFGHTAYDWLQEAFHLSVQPGAFVAGRYIEYRGYPVVVPSQWQTQATASTALTQ